MIAENFDAFVEKTCEALRLALNTPVGQELTEQLLAAKLKQTPGMTKDEWDKTKQQFMVFLFSKFVQDSPGVMQELAGHVWEELHDKGGKEQNEQG